MSMLAERREKKKWSVDPRGTNWSKDENKFGMKMLQKMGWSKGKGLGANENGEVDHVKITFKNDNRGVGCTLKHEKSWVAHQDDFSSLLAQLNDHHGDTSEEKEVTNLEKNSKSQKRVHYQKFARGKDLSNYKNSDLAAIFGKPVSQSAPVTPQNLSEEETSDAGSCSSCPEKKKKKKKKLGPQINGFSNQVTSVISVQDYFAQRMAMLKNKGSPKPSPMSIDRTENKVTDDVNEVTGMEDISQKSIEEMEKPRKKKKRKRKEDISKFEDDETRNETIKKKKKSKQSHDKDRTENYEKSVANTPQEFKKDLKSEKNSTKKKKKTYEQEFAENGEEILKSKKKIKKRNRAEDL